MMKKHLLLLTLVFPCWLFGQVTVQSELAGNMPVYLGNVDFTKVNYYRVGKNYENPTADNGTTLNPSQVARLQAIINSPKAYIQEHSKSCFRPESQFVFFDADKEIQGQLVLSFDCDALLAQPDIPMMLVTPNAGLSEQGEKDLLELVAELSQTAPTAPAAAATKPSARMIPEELAKAESPKKAETATRGMETKTKNASAEGTHIVKKGDTLYSICKANGLKVADLRAANHLSGDNLRVGQTLVLPVKN